MTSTGNYAVFAYNVPKGGWQDWKANFVALDVARAYALNLNYETVEIIDLETCKLCFYMRIYR